MPNFSDELRDGAHDQLHAAFRDVIADPERTAAMLALYEAMDAAGVTADETIMVCDDGSIRTTTGGRLVMASEDVTPAMLEFLG